MNSRTDIVLRAFGSGLESRAFGSGLELRVFGSGLELCVASGSDLESLMTSSSACAIARRELEGWRL